jgi:hypothetical protein
LDYDHRLVETGTQDTLRLTRALDLPRGARLSTSLGARHMPSGETYPIGTLDYSRDTQRGRISLSLSHDAVSNNDDEEVLRSQIRASYREELPAGARWSITGTVADSEFTDPALADITSAQLSFTYAMPLTRDWDLASGVRLRETREEGVAAQQNSTVFLSLERRFFLRP